MPQSWLRRPANPSNRHDNVLSFACADPVVCECLHADNQDAYDDCHANVFDCQISS
jgi:hypothetical protein